MVSSYSGKAARKSAFDKRQQARDDELRREHGVPTQAELAAMSAGVPTTTQATPTPPKPSVPTTFTDVKTGNASGISLPDGRTFLGLNPEDVKQIAETETAKNQAIAGTIPQAQVAQMQERAAAAQQVGITQPTGQIENQPRDFSNAIAAGLGQAAIGGAAGAGIGAIGGPVGALTGGAAGVIGGFIRGFTGKLKQDANQGIQAEYTTLAKNTRNMRYLIQDVNKGNDPELSLQAFNMQLAAIDEAYSTLKIETNKNLNKWLSVDTQIEMANFELFYQDGGLRDIYVQRMQIALLNPNPNSPDLLPSELEMEDLQQ